MKCQVCRRRNGEVSWLDEDFIGSLCSRCHFGLVRLIKGVIEVTDTLRRVDGKAVVRLVKAMFAIWGGR